MSQLDTFYDRYGRARLRLLNNGRLVDFAGHSIGFVHQNHLYNYGGRHIGWIEGGVMRDNHGRCLAFGEHPTDSFHPIFPIKQIKPIPGIVAIEPIRPIRSIPPIKPIKSSAWSEFDPVGIFG